MKRYSMHDSWASRSLAERQAASAERQAASTEQQAALMKDLVKGQVALLQGVVDRQRILEEHQAGLGDALQIVIRQNEGLVRTQEDSGQRQEKLQEKQLDEAKKQTGLVWRALIVAIIALIVAIIGASAAGVGVWRDIKKTQADVKQVGAEVRKGQFVITSPADYSEVGLGQVIRGRTPFPDRNHYIVVTLVRTGTAYVQDEPAFVSPDGTFTGEARFGNQAVGEDDEFRIQVLATKAILGAGILAEIPDDAIFSESLTVRRVAPSGNQIVITSPTDGAEVAFDDKILGTTPFPEMNHYIVVTPVKIGTAFVQDNPASANRVRGTFSGTARFGGAEVGVGEQFIVRVVATRSKLPAGPLTHEPDDAVPSNSVTVRRKK